MPLPLIPLIGGALTALGLGIDWMIAKDMDDSVSQLEALMNSIEMGASFEDMVSQCWMVFLGLGFVIWLGACIAFPKNSGDDKRRSSA